MFDPSNSVAMPKFYSDGTVLMESDFGSEDWPHSLMRTLYSDKHYSETRRASEACPAIFLRSDGNIDRTSVLTSLKSVVKLGASCYSKSSRNL